MNSPSVETNLRNAFLLLSPLPKEGEGGVRGKYSQKLKAESVRYARFQLSAFNFQYVGSNDNFLYVLAEPTITPQRRQRHRR